MHVVISWAQRMGLNGGRMLSRGWATQVTLHRCGVGQVEGGCPVEPSWEQKGRRLGERLGGAVLDWRWGQQR